MRYITKPVMRVEVSTSDMFNRAMKFLRENVLLAKEYVEFESQVWMSLVERGNDFYLGPL